MDEKRYEVYLQERNSLVNAELEQARQFDKYILTLAAGTFGLSLLFIRQLVPSPEQGTICLLVTAWIAFGASILTTLISFLLSQTACSKQREILKTWYKKKDTELREEGMKNVFAIWTRTLNWTSMSLFIIGVVLLIIFSAVNLLP